MLIRPAIPADAADIEALLDRAFGPARLLRTASLLRAGATAIAPPSLIARDDHGGLLGSIQYWPIVLVAEVASFPLTLLGPLAVATPGIGVGRALLAQSLAVADRIGLDPILLIGDAPYYGPFGFAAAATGGWSLPGPVERDRLLLRERLARPLPSAGDVAAYDSATPARATMVAADG